MNANDFDDLVFVPLATWDPHLVFVWNEVMNCHNFNNPSSIIRHIFITRKSNSITISIYFKYLFGFTDHGMWAPVQVCIHFHFVLADWIHFVSRCTLCTRSMYSTACLLLQFSRELMKHLRPLLPTYLQKRPVYIQTSMEVKGQGQQ